MKNLFKKDVSVCGTEDRVLGSYEGNIKYGLHKIRYNKNSNKVSKNIIIFID